MDAYSGIFDESETKKKAMIYMLHQLAGYNICFQRNELKTLLFKLDHNSYPYNSHNLSVKRREKGSFYK